MGELHDRARRGTHTDHPAHAKSGGKWDPGADFNGDHMTISTGGLPVSEVANPLQPDPAVWRPHFDRFGLDADEWEIVGNVRFNIWDQVIATDTVRQMVQLKAEWRPRSFRDFDPALVDRLAKASAARKRQRRALPDPDSHDGFYWRLACIGDTQLGKDGPESLHATKVRLYDRRDMVVDRLRASRRRGVTRLGVPSLGDLVEGVCGHYGNQLATISGGWRHQLNEVIDVLTDMVQAWADEVDEVVVLAVPGNHGEAYRVEGKQATDLSDNFDLFVWEQVRRVTSANPDRYGHVSYNVPASGLTASYDFGGTIVGALHGHQTRQARGSEVDAKVHDWWRGQTFNAQPLQHAHLLLSGHWHWFFHRRPGVRGHIGIPAMDSGSQWWTDKTGQDAPPGMVTLEVGGGEWGRVEVL